MYRFNIKCRKKPTKEQQAIDALKERERMMIDEETMAGRQRRC